MKHLADLLHSLDTSGDTTSLNLHDHITSYLDSDWGGDRPPDLALARNALNDMKEAVDGAIAQLEGKG